MLKKGDKGEAVKELQLLLIEAGAYLVADGIFGEGTEKAVAQFQRKSKLYADGIAGPKTMQALRYSTATKFSDIVDIWQPLPVGEYIQGELADKIGVCLHHTVSQGSPRAVVNGWVDDNRGAVGTHFVIGGIGKDGSSQYDGKILQCMRLEDWAHHILTKRMGFSNNHNNRVNKAYIGIEICSLGALKKEGDKFFDLSGKIEVRKEEVVTLDVPFRSYKYWHRYSDKQIEAVKRLLIELRTVLGFDYSSNIPKEGHSWFDLDWHALATGYAWAQSLSPRTLTTHTNFEYGKFDCYPQPELVQMLKEL